MKKVCTIKSVISFIIAVEMIFSTAMIGVSANDVLIEKVEKAHFLENEEIISEDDVVSIIIDEELELMTTTVNDENLITSVDNPRNGRISFYITLPAGAEAEWSVELIPHYRTGSIETSDGIVTNSDDSESTFRISVTTDYFSDQYVITASYEEGPSKNKYIYIDEDEAMSGVVTDVYSDAFIWDAENINKYQLGVTIGGIITTVATGTLEFMITRKVNPDNNKTYSTIISLLFMAIGAVGDYLDDPTSTIEIMTEPIQGWGYQIWFEPIGGGAYNRNLVVLDEYGDVYSTHLLGTYYCEGVMISVG